MNEDRTTNSNGSKWISPAGELVVMTFEETERWMLARLQDETRDRKKALKHLACFYADHRRYDQSLEMMRELVKLETDLEEKAACVLATGAIAEKKEDFQAAVQFYREAFAMEPERTDVWYFVNNNLGYSLNKLGQFAEGEKFCRAAIEINPSRPNGFKNLGIALAGQGQFAEAAKCYVQATQVNASDGRSLALLQQLLQAQPELESEFRDDLAVCEQAVKWAAGLRNLG